MQWASTYQADNQPTSADMAAFIATPLWNEMNRFLQEGYDSEPTQSYSICAGQPGWNVKYKKAGRSLCTLYPMDGFFIALVVIGAKEEAAAELLMPSLSAYTQNLFANTKFSAGGRWLMIHVTEDAVLEDVKKLIQLRRKTKK